MADLSNSLEKILLGAPRGIVLVPRTANGPPPVRRALVGMLTPDADPVRRVIIPQGMALGSRFPPPTRTGFPTAVRNWTPNEGVTRRARGRRGSVRKDHTGAESDIQQPGRIARQMVGRWGMSDKLGPITLVPSEGQVGFCPAPARSRPKPSGWWRKRCASHEDAPPQVTKLLRNPGTSWTASPTRAQSRNPGRSDAYAAAGVPMRTAELEVAAAT